MNICMCTAYISIYYVYTLMYTYIHTYSRQPGRQAGRQTDRQIHRHTCMHAYIHSEREGYTRAHAHVLAHIGKSTSIICIWAPNICDCSDPFLNLLIQGLGQGSLADRYHSKHTTLNLQILSPRKRDLGFRV